MVSASWLHPGCYMGQIAPIFPRERALAFVWTPKSEKDVAAHPSVLAWKPPQTEEPGRLQSMGLQRVRRDWPQKSDRKEQASAPGRRGAYSNSACVKGLLGPQLLGRILSFHRPEWGRQTGQAGGGVPGCWGTTESTSKNFWVMFTNRMQSRALQRQNCCC